MRYRAPPLFLLTSCTTRSLRSFVRSTCLIHNSTKCFVAGSFPTAIYSRRYSIDCLDWKFSRSSLVSTRCIRCISDEGYRALWWSKRWNPEFLHVGIDLVVCDALPKDEGGLPDELVICTDGNTRIVGNEWSSRAIQATGQWYSQCHDHILASLSSTLRPLLCHS